MDSSPERYSPLGTITLFNLEGSAWLVLLVFGCPLEFNFHMKLPLWLQLQPDVMLWLPRLFLDVETRFSDNPFRVKVKKSGEIGIMFTKKLPPKSAK